MRILFLHSSRAEANEYLVHLALAAAADPRIVESYFVWHRPSRLSPADPESAPARTWYRDFGVDGSTPDLAGRARRVVSMLVRSPGALLFAVSKIRELRPDVIYSSQQRHEVVLGSLLARYAGIPHCVHVSYPFSRWLGRTA